MAMLAFLAFLPEFSGSEFLVPHVIVPGSLSTMLEHLFMPSTLKCCLCVLKPHLSAGYYSTAAAQK